MKETRRGKYAEALKTIPAPGHGDGAHGAILGVANHGLLAKISAGQIFKDIRSSIPPGKRIVSDREIEEAIKKAMLDFGNGSFTPTPNPTPAVRDGKAVLRRIIQQGKLSDAADLWEASPIRLLEEPHDDATLFLETLFKPDDLLWIGERYEKGIPGETIRSAAEWINNFRNGGKTKPFIIINPLDGKPAHTKTGELTFRGDENVCSLRHALVEFDNLSHQEQIRFFSAVKMPILALVDTGGKSIHGWIDVQQLAIIETSAQWDVMIRTRLFDRLLGPMGADNACKNPARLSRLPGYYRSEKKRYQNILWLSPMGRTIC